MNLIERAKNIIVAPKSEWEVIAPETTPTAELYKSYIVPLAAIGPVASFIGLSLVGFGPFRVPILAGLTNAIVAYVLGLVGVFIIALIINALAPTFGGEKNQMQALKVAAYSYTPAWIAGVLHIVPALGILVLLASLYGLYVLYLGLPVLMKSPKEKAVGYTVVVVICAILIGVVFAAVVGAIAGFGYGPGRMSMGTHGGGATAALGGSSLSPETNAKLEALKQFGDKMEAAGKKMEMAQKSGDAQSTAAAAAEAMGVIMSGGTQVDPVDQNLLKAMLPESIAGLKRTKLEAEKTGMAGIKVAKAEGGYGDDQGRNVDLTITDMGGAKMLGGLAAWAMIEQEKETDSGYEKTGKIDGRMVHEQFNKSSQSGNYEVVVGNRFLVSAHGYKIGMDTLKQAVATVDLSKLDGMKDQGVKQ
jgi:hypothetical protein